MKTNKSIKISEETRREISFLYWNGVRIEEIKHLMARRFGKDIGMEEFIDLIFSRVDESKEKKEHIEHHFDKLNLGGTNEKYNFDDIGIFLAD